MKGLFKGCWTIPNLLSLLRIIVIPIFAYFFIKGEAVLAIVMLALSGISDFLDGKIADKLTQITLAVLLFVSFNQASDEMLKAFSWVFLVFIVKELVMVVFGGIMLLLNLRPSAAEIYGKVATFAFYAIMILIVAFGPEVGMLREVMFELPKTLMMILVVVSAILTLVAFVSYLPDTFRQFKEKFSKK